MKIVIDIPNNLFERIKHINESGKIPSISDFFLVAAENQLSLENASLEKHQNIILPIDSIATKTREKWLILPKKEFVRTVEMPKNNQLIHPETSTEEVSFIWGQINRIFPLKIGLRVLSNMLVEKNDDYIELEEFSAEASQVAQKIRKLLVEKTQHISGKKDSLWAGLPAENSGESMQRYKSLFLAYLRKDNIIEGGLGKLKFINLIRKEDKQTYIGITEPGLEFCLLENPILDKNEYNINALSEHEIEFYLKHISMFVPGEKKAFIDILNLLNKGITRIISLNSELEKLWPQNWSKSVINTQRNGVISRLFELGMVKKVKTGIEVEYIITKSGKSFIDSVERTNKYIP